MCKKQLVSSTKIYVILLPRKSNLIIIIYTQLAKFATDSAWDRVN